MVERVSLAPSAGVRPSMKVLTANTGTILRCLVYDNYLCILNRTKLN